MLRQVGRLARVLFRQARRGGSGYRCKRPKSTAPGRQATARRGRLELGVKPQSALPFPGRRPLRFLDSELCSRASCGRVGVELRAGSLFVGRREKPSCVAWNALHTSLDRGQSRRPTSERSLHTDGSIGGLHFGFDLGRENPPAEGRTRVSTVGGLPWSGLLFQTGRGAVSFAAILSPARLWWSRAICRVLVG